MAAAKNGRIALLLAALALSAQLAPAAATWCGSNCPTTKPPPPPCQPPPPTPTPATPTTPPTPWTPPPATPTPPTPTPWTPTPATPPPTPATPATPTTPPTPAPAPSTPTGKCPVDTLKLLACVDALNGLVHAVVGATAGDTCCPLLSGVADLDAALCLCTAIKAEALGVSLVFPVAISVLVNECGKHVPSSFQCPS
uniref:Bifunctional inhibitor/plant lipid transfer protein/seed storage helical domain-containing protein n=1 Tax=Oryza nivara TaxID=4536 RepID=A0A0E0H5U9_ORYNI